MFIKIPKKQKRTTIILALMLTVMVYQTYSLIRLTTKLNQTQISFAQPANVNLSDGNGAQPDMVGGC